MRITFILPTVSMGGGTRVVGIYARELMQMGHTVRLVSPPPQSELLWAKLKSWLKGGGWPADKSHPPSHLDNSGVDHRLLDKWRPVTNDDVPEADIVIATWWETAEWVSVFSSEKGAKVYFIQGYEVYPYLPVERSRATYRLPMHKVVVSNWLKKIMACEYKDPVVDVVPNSVDHTLFFAPPRGKQPVPTVGLLYSSASMKNLDLALAALSIVKKRITELRIICFGSEYPRSHVEPPVAKDFFFSPPQDQIRTLYSACDVWLTASSSEGFNLTAMEAMACRTPVVATRTGWPEESVRSGWNGMLVEIDDLIGLAEAVEWVITRGDGAWRTLSSNAYATVASSSWKLSAAMFEAALRHACRRAARKEIAGRCDDLNISDVIVARTAK